MNHQALYSGGCDGESCHTGNQSYCAYYGTSELYPYQHSEGKYEDPTSSSIGPQEQFYVIEMQNDEGTNYSSSLFADSILQTYESTFDDPIQNVHGPAYNSSLSFPEPLLPRDSSQTDYTVYELSTPGAFNTSDVKRMNYAREVAVYQDNAHSGNKQSLYSDPQNTSSLNSIHCDENHSVYQNSFYSPGQLGHAVTYAPVQVVSSSCAYTSVYNSVSETESFYVNDSHANYSTTVTSQGAVIAPHEHFYPHSSCYSYTYPQPYSTNQLTVPPPYTQSTCYVAQPTTFSSQYQGLQESYQDFQPTLYQGQGGNYTGPYTESAQPVWHDYCEIQHSQWSSQVPSGCGYREDYNPMHLYNGSRTCSYEQRQQHAFDFAETYPPNAQNDTQGLQPLQKSVQAFEKSDSTNKMPDSALSETVQEQRLDREIEDEDDDTPSLSHPGSPCEPAHEYACSQCNKRFDRPSHLEIHFRTHTGERPFRCCICSKSFSQASNLQRHMKSHRTWPKLRPLNGTMSSTHLLVKPSRSIMSVTRRVRVLSTSAVLNCSLVDNTFECRFCGTRMKGFQKMRSHLVEHNDEKVYQCIVSSCLKTFTELADFTNHLSAAHDLANSKWLRCNKCNKQFENVSDVLRHYATKRGTISHCSPHNFPSKSQRNKTSKSRQSRRSYSTRLRCPICEDRRFTRYGLLRFHLLNCHAVASVSETSVAKSARSQNLNTPASQTPTTQPAIPVSQDTILTSKSELTKSLGDCGNSDGSVGSSVSAEASRAELSTDRCDPLRLDNVHLVVSRRPVGVAIVAAKRNGRQGIDNHSLACPLCGRVFKKRKFFEDHCALCQQKQAEIERRQRWRDSRRRPCKSLGLDGAKTAIMATFNKSLPLEAPSSPPRTASSSPTSQQPISAS